MNELPPISDKFSTLIASREFELSSKTGIDNVIVEIGLPVNDVKTIDGYDWRCPVRIIIGTKIITDQACGGDSIQALDIAMGQLIELRLESIIREKNAKLLLHGKEYNFKHK